MPRAIALLLLICVWAPLTGARDVFLTIGGGGSPRNNQASLESNVIFFQRVLSDLKEGDAPNDIYFACGNAPDTDLQFSDPNAKPPRANVVLTRLFNKDEEALYQTYRPHHIENVKGPANHASIKAWFAGPGARLADEDRLFIYFTGHGGQGKSPRNTTMDLWHDNAMPVRELAELLDKLNPRVQVVLIMVQCHAGGFADVLFRDGVAGPALAQGTRCGFFATWPTRLAAGCTPDTAEENYKDYTTYFYAALSGKTRTGQIVPPPDYDHDGRVSMSEAHAYVLLTSDTVDIPLCTSDVFLRQFSKVQDDQVRDLYTAVMPFEELLKLASPDRRAVLEGLATQLQLKGDEKVTPARSLADRLERDRKKAQRQQDRAMKDAEPLALQMQEALMTRWPQIDHQFHPEALRALTNDASDLVKAIESHPQYGRWNDLMTKSGDASGRAFELERTWVKCQRFLYVVDSVVLEANLPRLANKLVQQKYEALRKAENSPIGPGGK